MTRSTPLPKRNLWLYSCVLCVPTSFFRTSSCLTSAAVLQGSVSDFFTWSVLRVVVFIFTPIIYIVSKENGANWRIPVSLLRSLVITMVERSINVFYFFSWPCKRSPLSFSWPSFLGCQRAHAQVPVPTIPPRDKSR